MKLDPVSLRVLGALMEKEMTTPESYPLSLNSILAAANQKTSREPVMEISEDEARSALDRLQAHDLISVTRDGRVPKYEHRIRTVLNLRRDETAILCLLILRGPQTTGELRARSDRMFRFEDLTAVQATLDRLAGRESPLVRPLPRVPGSREIRSTHLLIDQDAIPFQPAEAPTGSPHQEELAMLREALASLEGRVSALEARSGVET